ncbi:MAG: hypothetical protein IJ607_08245, partial [Bacteroidaceae bacterium]|nr:hypothetical protein [Bacteroidaceae bacterium]
VLRRSFVRTRTSTTPVWMGSVRVGALVLQRLLPCFAGLSCGRGRPQPQCGWAQYELGRWCFNGC